MSLGTRKSNSQSPNGAIPLPQSPYIAPRSPKASGLKATTPDLDVLPVEPTRTVLTTSISSNTSERNNSRCIYNYSAHVAPMLPVATTGGVTFSTAPQLNTSGAFLITTSSTIMGCQSEPVQKQRQSSLHQESRFLNAVSRENAKERRQTGGLRLIRKRTRSQSPQETKVHSCNKRRNKGPTILLSPPPTPEVTLAAGPYSYHKGGSAMGLSISSKAPEEEFKRPSLIVKLKVSLQKALKRRQVCRIRLAAALPSALEVSSWKPKDLEVVVESIKGIRILETQSDSSDNRSALGQWMELVSVYLLYCKDAKDPPAFDEPLKTLRMHGTVSSEIRRWRIEHHIHATGEWSRCVVDELVEMADWGSELPPGYAEEIMKRFVQFNKHLFESSKSGSLEES